MPLATVETNKSVTAFIDSIKNESKREDAKKIVKMIQKITGKKPKVWGDNFIIGYGKYTYKRKGGKEEFEWFNVGFAPKENKLTFYLTLDLTKDPLVKKLGKCKHGKGCLHINKLADVDEEVLKELITKGKDLQWFQE